MVPLESPVREIRTAPFGGRAWNWAYGSRIERRRKSERITPPYPTGTAPLPVLYSTLAEGPPQAVQRPSGPKRDRTLSRPQNGERGSRPPETL